MKKSFSSIVKAAYSLPLEEHLELFNLLGKNISEEKRNNIHSNSLKAMQEEKKKKLVFSSDQILLKENLLGKLSATYCLTTPNSPARG
ncbi:MAG: hypothetical protein IH597_14535 [Bacteroidales bacterium]|nr:hypothetical protein [Bacteroidales bacterium]